MQKHYVSVSLFSFALLCSVSAIQSMEIEDLSKNKNKQYGTFAHDFSNEQEEIITEFETECKDARREDKRGYQVKYGCLAYCCLGLIQCQPMNWCCLKAIECKFINNCCGACMFGIKLCDEMCCEQKYVVIDKMGV